MKPLKHMTKFTEEDADTMGELLIRGVPLRLVAEIYKCSIVCVRNHTKEIDIKEETRKRIQALHVLVKAGYDKYYACELLNVPITYLTRETTRNTDEDRNSTYYLWNQQTKQEVKIEGIDSLREWCIKNYYQYSGVKAVLDGRRNSIFGWKIKRQ